MLPVAHKRISSQKFENTQNTFRIERISQSNLRIRDKWELSLSKHLDNESSKPPIFNSQKEKIDMLYNRVVEENASMQEEIENIDSLIKSPAYKMLSKGYKKYIRNVDESASCNPARNEKRMVIIRMPKYENTKIFLKNYLQIAKKLEYLRRAKPKPKDIVINNKIIV
eukprot:TRINITY_DN8318_c0_g1_i2.p1 TRINITY_DN8318_c0_g1~~TRINITY_DN8318_c0_g1_i2.p1  ORF type:complete len:168 (+),score=15.45 TRINITY_DN8318_c0_g1_i2:93-596(+)